jgi:hypothetical protein
VPREGLIMRWILAVPFVIGCVALGAASCGSSSQSGFDDDAGLSSGSSGPGTSGFVTADTGTGSGVTCSSDLRDIVDSNGNVIQTCPPDQGCAAGACVAACASAEQNKSTIGCSYYVAQPDIIKVGTGACFAAFIANTWVSPVKITVERAGQALDVAAMARIPSGSGQSLTYAPLTNGELPPGQVAIVFLSRFGSALVSCPAGVTPGYTAAPGNVTGTGIGEAFHITTSAPVVAYDIFPYGGGQSAATSATLLLPTSAWDTNYIGVNAYRKSTAVPEAQPFLQIVAQEDGTDVQILPVAAITGGTGVAPAAAGANAKYSLNKGQLLQLEQPVELTGSAIQANKPIGVFGGATCLSVDVSATACDGAHQELPPVRALGSQYVGVRYRNRFDAIEESPPWRLVGAVDGTTLSYEPSAPSGAPTTLNLGQVAEFKSAGPFVVKSQDDNHPFYISAHMTGCATVGSSSDCRGDPEFVNVIPPQQYLKSYVFFTDPTYPETDLVVIRSKTNGAFADVTLDCAGGPLTGWQPAGASGDFEYTRFDLVRGNFQKQGSCDNGRHEMKSTAPFGLTVWGWGSAATGGGLGLGGGGFFSQAVSYAYPAGASVKPVNTVIVSAVK